MKEDEKKRLDNSADKISDRLYNQHRNQNKPLLTIYLMRCKFEDIKKGIKVEAGDLLTYSISFPSQVNHRQVRKEYQANVVYQQLEMDLNDEEDIESLVND